MTKKIFNSKQFNSLFSMHNKVVAIFGGTGKLGEEFAKTLSNYGVKVYVLDIKNTTKKNNETF